MAADAKALKPKYKVELVVSGRSHLYDVTQGDKTVRYPGVTDSLGVINKPALVNWAKREALAMVEKAMSGRLGGKDSAGIVLDKAWIEGVIQDARKRPDQLKDQAADFGSRAHAFIDSIIKGSEPSEVPEEIAGPVRAFRDWWKSSGIEMVRGEIPVASVEHGYGGTLDALGRRRGRYVVLDWKTSNGIYTEYALQTSAYVHALRETYGLECSEAIVVRFGKKLPVEFEFKELADVELSFHAFLAAKALKEALAQSHFQTW